jgi:two-component system, response regulator
VGGGQRHRHSVIVFSSSAHPNDIARAYRLGANSFVVKPADTTARLDFIQALRGWWLTFNQTL